MKGDTKERIEWALQILARDEGEQSTEIPKRITAVGASELADAPPSQSPETRCPEADPEAYETGFGRWAASRCVFRDRCWGGIGALHVDYARWCDQQGQEVPASRRTFERILLSQGLWREEDLRGGLVYGLILREDWEATLKAEYSQKKQLPRVLSVSGRVAAAGGR